MTFKKILLIFTIVIIVLIGFVYVNFFTNNTNLVQKELYIKIPTGSTFEQVNNITFNILCQQFSLKMRNTSQLSV